MTVFEFDGRKLPLRFSTKAWLRMDKEVCTVNELFALYRSAEGERSRRLDGDTVEKTLKVAVIFAEAAKADPPVTYEELEEKLEPGEVIALEGVIIEEVGNGYSMENKKTGPRDLVLEELDAKEGKNA